jgi:hypothetical protein
LNLPRSSSNQQLPHLTKGNIITISHNQIPNNDIKDRPYLILWQVQDDYAICSITSTSGRPYAIMLNATDMKLGKMLYYPSYIRPNIIYTVKFQTDWIPTNYSPRTVSDEILDKVISQIKLLVDLPKTQPSVSPQFQRPSKKERIR